MMTTYLGSIVPTLVALIATGLFGLAYAGFRRDLDRARERISTGSQIAQTRCGLIEYAVAGRGPPVLVVHGGEGGFDQGLAFAEPLVRSGFRVIAMSRFGYLRTPLPVDASPEAQANAHACLLDALHIDRAALITASAGAPSSLQFALRHPERLSTLVLLVPVAYSPRPEGTPQVRMPLLARTLAETTLRSDFLFWLVSRVARRTMIRTFLGIPTAVMEGATADEKMRVRRIFERIAPVRARLRGLLNDAAINASLPRYALEKITAPTLVIGTRDDLFGTFDSARYTAAHIPHARFIGYPDGGHLWVGHQDEVVSEVVGFLRTAGGPRFGR
ncbi:MULTISPECIES: alpha/beta fold hydrolase [Methylococcus]|uniref:Alpha/beta fold hydrolase n=1 Tax=Methylococcus capsulatus TaxID=414 RepID=A0ABZ2F3F9_METCP|nr:MULTISPECIES: alpha/beta hydrolase [Methylococcus]MDF9392236.1 alpha/beta fold hydrolase [Methylococcus capsulatus]